MGLSKKNSAADTVGEVWGLVRDYAKQETVEPLKGLARFAKWGLIGSLLVGIGVILLTVAVLRLVQAETGDALDGNWTPVPYLVTLVVAVAVMALAARAMAGKGRS